MLQKTAHTIDRINQRIGWCVAWLALLMVLAMTANVIGRYAFNTTLIWQQELVGFMHAVMFLAAAGYTLLDENHVRVDIVYQRGSQKYKAAVDLAGTVLFLFPLCIAIVYFSYEFVISSWRLWESSPEYNGMKGVFVLKTFIWVFAGTLFLQGISTVCKSLTTLRRP